MTKNKHLKYGLKKNQEKMDSINVSQGHLAFNILLEDKETLVLPS